MSALETIGETAAGVVLGGLVLIGIAIAAAGRARSHMQQKTKEARRG